MYNQYNKISYTANPDPVPHTHIHDIEYIATEIMQHATEYIHSGDNITEEDIMQLLIALELNSIIPAETCGCLMEILDAINSQNRPAE
jgi:type III secretion system FlhB-like substrate exporter